MASASARQAAAGSDDVRTAAERLGANRVVEGTSFCDARRVRFEVRLSDRQARVIWSDRAEGALDEILQVHETLVVRVAAALGQDLPFERRARIGRINPDAQRVLVQGLMSLLTSRTSDPHGTLIESARQALVLAPDYADAHRVLAEMLAETVYFGMAEGSQRAALDEAMLHADRAVKLDPTNGLAFVARAKARFVGGDRDGAEADFRQAMLLAPGSGWVQWAWSWYLSHFGRYDECVTAGDRAAALDPLTPTNASGWCLFVAGRYAEAASRFEEQLVGRGWRGPHVLLAATYARAGRVAEAGRMRDALLKVTPLGTDPAIDWWLIYVYLAEGDRGTAQRIAEHWWRKKDKNAAEWGMLAQMYGALDDVDRVVESIRQALNKCGNPDPCWDGGLLSLSESIFSERVRHDPRILRMLEEARARESTGAGSSLANRPGGPTP